MPRDEDLGDIAPERTPEDPRRWMKTSAAIQMAKLIIWTSALFVAGWSIVSFIPVFGGGDFDKARMILSDVASYWGPISGAALGFMFGVRNNE